MESIMKKIGIFLISIPACIVLIVATIITLIIGMCLIIISCPFIIPITLIKKGWKGVLNIEKETIEIPTEIPL